MMDRVFEIVFARCRRKVGDSRIESAWRNATHTVWMYAFWGMFGLGAIAWTVLNSLVGIVAVQTKVGWVIGSVLIALASTRLFDLRFKKYLLFPPVLPEHESASEKRLVFVFRAISIGIFLFTCAVGFFLPPAGGR